MSAVHLSVSLTNLASLIDEVLHHSAAISRSPAIIVGVHALSVERISASEQSRFVDSLVFDRSGSLKSLRSQDFDVSAPENRKTLFALWSNGLRSIRIANKHPTLPGAIPLQPSVEP